jgi:hypothetical protein
MPGYLDLPLASGHKLDRVTDSSAFAEFYGDLETAEKAYRDALASMGWTEVDERKLRKGEGPEARCIEIMGWIVWKAQYPRLVRPHSISFTKASCSSPPDWLR